MSEEEKEEQQEEESDWMGAYVGLKKDMIDVLKEFDRLLQLAKEEERSLDYQVKNEEAMNRKDKQVLKNLISAKGEESGKVEVLRRCFRELEASLPLTPSDKQAIQGMGW